MEKVEDDMAWDNVMCHINEEQLAIVKGIAKDEEIVITGAITNLESVIGYTLVVDEIISY